MSTAVLSHPLTSTRSAKAPPRGRTTTSPSVLDMVQQVRTGFKPTTLDALAASLGVGQEQAIALLNLPRSTIKRQQSEGRSFSPDISDRLYRARKLLDVSREAIGDDAAAVRWLLRAHPALGGVTALSLVDTTVGYERVLDELQRIANGVAA